MSFCRPLERDKDDESFEDNLVAFKPGIINMDVLIAGNPVESCLLLHRLVLIFYKLDDIINSCFLLWLGCANILFFVGEASV